MWSEMIDFATYYSIYTGYFLFVCAIIGNTLNILVFTQIKAFRDSRGAFYLTVESFFNSVYQCVPITLTILTSIYGDDRTGASPIWCKFRYIWTQTLVLITYNMICFAAIDQYVSTNYRYNLRDMCTLKLCRCFAFTCVCVWIIHSTAFGMSFDIQTSVGCIVSNPIARQYSTIFLYPVLLGLLPIAIASFFSLLAFRNVRHIVRRQMPIIRRRLDRQMTAMVLIRVVIYVFLALPYILYRIYDVSVPNQRTKVVEYAIRRLVQAILYSLFISNYAVSFYIFMLTSSRFHRQVKFVVVKKCWRRLKSRYCCSRHHQIAPDNPDSYGASIELEENL